MDQGYAALLGAGIGAICALLGSFVKSELGTERERKRELRTKVAELVSTMGAAQQAMEWISWFALNYPRPEGFDLRLMSAVNGVSRIPTEGRNLVVVAVVDRVLHFRIFDGVGKMVVDTDEKRLTERGRPIEDLRNQLESLWPPHELTGSEKGRVIPAVTSIVGHTRPEEKPDGETNIDNIYKQCRLTYEQKIE
jgi:hypothetical protein